MSKLCEVCTVAPVRFVIPLLVGIAEFDPNGTGPQGPMWVELSLCPSCLVAYKSSGGVRLTDPGAPAAA